MSWLASQFPCEVSLFLCGAHNKSIVFFRSPQRESALQRRLPGDWQEPQVSETQQCCWWEGSAGWCGQQNQQGQWQGADAQDAALECIRCLAPFYLSASSHRRVNSFFFDLKGTARIFLLTKNRVFLADQKTGQVKASVPLPDLASVSVSTQADGFFALKLKEVRNIPYFHRLS